MKSRIKFNPHTITYFILVVIGIILSFSTRYIVFKMLLNKSFEANTLLCLEPTGYVNEAHNIINGGEWFMGIYNGHYQLLTIRPKGYSLLIALTMAFDPKNYMDIIRHFRIICDVIAGILIYLTCNNIFHNRSIALLSLYLWAINPFAIFTCVQDMPDGFGCFFVSIFIFLYYHTYHKHMIKYILLGFSCAISVLFRSEYLLIIIVIFISDFILQQDIKKHLFHWFVSSITFLLVLSPWMIYSYIKLGHPLMASTSAWGSAYMAIGEKENNAVQVSYGDSFVDWYARENGIDGAYVYEGNVFYKQLFLNYLKNHPLEYAELVFKYRVPRAFVPGINISFNLNRHLNNELFIDYCAVFPRGTLKRSVCTQLQSQAAHFEKTTSRYLSLIFLLTMLIFILKVVKTKKIKSVIFLLLLYFYFPVVICLLKQVEYRNVMPSQVCLHIAFSYISYSLIYFFSTKIRKIKNIN